MRCSDASHKSIDFDQAQVGYHAAAMLDRLMNGDTPPAGPEYIPPAELVLSQPTDILAVDDPLVARAEHRRGIAPAASEPREVPSRED